MTNKPKTIQANYSAELVSVIIADYAQLMAKNANDNKIVLQIMSEKYGKSVHSLRAKLSSLKVYISANSADTDKPIVGDKVTKKEDIACAISTIIGQELTGLEAATKATLQAILAYLLKVSKQLEEKEAKIESLIAEMLDEEPYIADDINDDD